MNIYKSLIFNLNTQMLTVTNRPDLRRHGAPEYRTEGGMSVSEGRNGGDERHPQSN